MSHKSDNSVAMVARLGMFNGAEKVQDEEGLQDCLQSLPSGRGMEDITTLTLSWRNDKVQGIRTEAGKP